jgi:hypothetical protein
MNHSFDYHILLCQVHLSSSGNIISTGPYHDPSGLNSGVPKGYVIPVLLVTPVVFLFKVAINIIYPNTSTIREPVG